MRAARAGATTVEAFVADGFRAYFAFIAGDPETVRLISRNAGTIRSMVGAGVEVGLAMVARDPIDVPHAADFVTSVFVGAFVHMRLR